MEKVNKTALPLKVTMYAIEALVNQFQLRILLRRKKKKNLKLGLLNIELILKTQLNLLASKIELRV